VLQRFNADARSRSESNRQCGTVWRRCIPGAHVKSNTASWHVGGILAKLLQDCLGEGVSCRDPQLRVIDVREVRPEGCRELRCALKYDKYVERGSGGDSGRDEPSCQRISWVLMLVCVTRETSSSHGWDSQRVHSCCTTNA
jgi:hypothetical protein